MDLGCAQGRCMGIRVAAKAANLRTLKSMRCICVAAIYACARVPKY